MIEDDDNFLSNRAKRALDAMEHRAQAAEGDWQACKEELDAAWFGIEHGYDIEPRAELEQQAKTNGFRFGLAQAIHHIWKREPEVAELEADCTALRATVERVKALVASWLVRFDFNVSRRQVMLEEFSKALAPPANPRTPPATPGEPGA